MYIYLHRIFTPLKFVKSRTIEPQKCLIFRLLFSVHVRYRSS